MDKNREFNSGAFRNDATGKGRYDLIPYDVIHELAKHYELGMERYGAYNWQKGIPTSSTLDSALRHTSQFAQGFTNENHLISAIWNLITLYWTMKNKPEMNDLPAWIGKEGYFYEKPLGALEKGTVEKVEAFDSGKAFMDCLMKGAEEK